MNKRLAPRVAMSDGRSLAGTSLAPETSARPILGFQWLAPRFLESRDTARRCVRYGSRVFDPAPQRLKRQTPQAAICTNNVRSVSWARNISDFTAGTEHFKALAIWAYSCLLYTSDAADE